MTDPASGNIYYVHAESGKTAWESPQQTADSLVNKQPTNIAGASSREDEVADELEDFSREVVGGVVDEMMTRMAEESQQEGVDDIADGEAAPGFSEEDVLSPEQLQGPLTAEAEANEQILPDGWEAIVDPGSGETYYYNANIDETSWERPVSSTSLVELEDQDDAPVPEEVHGGAPKSYE